MRALAVLTGDLDLFPNTNMEAHSYLWHEIKYPIIAFFPAPRETHAHGPHTHRQAHAQTHKYMKKSLK